MDRAWATETRTTLCRAQVFLPAQRASNSGLLRNHHRRLFKNISFGLMCMSLQHHGNIPSTPDGVPQGALGEWVSVSWEELQGIDGSARLGSPVQRSQGGEIPCHWKEEWVF